VRAPIGEDHPARLLFRQIRGEEPSGAGLNTEDRVGAEEFSPAAAEIEVGSGDAGRSQSISTSAEVDPHTQATASAGTTTRPGEPARRRQAVPVKLSFEEFVGHWGPLLRSGARTGKLDICRVLYEQTHAVGKKTYFSSYEKLGALVGLGKATTVKNVKQLEELGFLERIKIYNTATKKGTDFRLQLERLSPEERKKPTLHLYDDE
jgi:hypothetical protein